jgi:hypothetical protein
MMTCLLSCLLFAVQPSLHARSLGPSRAGSGRPRRVLGNLAAQQQTDVLGQLSNVISSLPVVGSALQGPRSGGETASDGSGKPKTTIPGPTPLPGGLGSSLDVLRIGGLHKAFQQYEEEYGSVFKLQIGANTTFVLVADPDLTRQITMSDFQTFRNRNSPGGGDGGAMEVKDSAQEEAGGEGATAAPTSSPVGSADSLAQRGGVGVVAATDEKWKAMRASAVSSFGNPKLMTEYSRIVTEETAALVRRLQVTN